MKAISILRICTGVFFACLLCMTQSMAAKPNKNAEEPPLGTWTQQGTDLNGDGILSGIESKAVFFFDEVKTLNRAPSIIFTLQVEGGCYVNIISCQQMPTASNPSPACKNYVPVYNPGYKARISFDANIGALGVVCDSGEEECAFTVSDVRP